MMKLKYFICGIALCALACSAGRDEGGGRAGGSDTLKVMSFNVRCITARDTGDRHWDVRRQAVVKMIATLRPDVVGLQEPRTAQRIYLKEKLRDYAYLEVPGTGDSKGGNTGLLYRRDRFTKVDDGCFFLSATPDEPSRCWDVGDSQWRTSVWVHLKETATGKEFYFLSTHMPVRTKSDYPNEPYLQARRRSSVLNVSRMKALAGDTGVCFIVGDMNCSEANDSGKAALEPYREWMSAGRDIEPAGEAYSFNAYGKGTPAPTRNLDHIFYRNATPVSFRTVADDYGVPYISDHYPILLTVFF